MADQFDHPLPTREWWAQAACRDTDADLFFPEREERPGRPSGPRHDVYAKARAICGRCPVIDGCRRDHWREQHGMWFGTTPDERKRMRGRLRRG